MKQSGNCNGQTRLRRKNTIKEDAFAGDIMVVAIVATQLRLWRRLVTDLIRQGTVWFLEPGRGESK